MKNKEESYGLPATEKCIWNILGNRLELIDKTPKSVDYIYYILSLSQEMNLTFCHVAHLMHFDREIKKQKQSNIFFIKFFCFTANIIFQKPTDHWGSNIKPQVNTA